MFTSHVVHLLTHKDFTDYIFQFFFSMLETYAWDFPAKYINLVIDCDDSYKVMPAKLSVKIF